MIELRISSERAGLSEILMAELTLIGYESFWEEPGLLRAYIDEQLFSEKKLQLLHKQYQHQGITAIHWEKMGANTWHKAQEDKYPPLLIGDQLLIKDPADPFLAEAAIQIEVLTALSFGSGAHPSTELCLKMMLHLSFEQSQVLDLGCGTGVLALLAEKMGASAILALDNNPWAIEVCRENLKINQSQKIELRIADISTLDKQRIFDVFLANLNATVLIQELEKYPLFLNPKGQLLMSGYMKKDKNQIDRLAQNASLQKVQELEKDSWIAALFQIN